MKEIANEKERGEQKALVRAESEVTKEGEEGEEAARSKYSCVRICLPL
jgi:hypothetical protein